MTRGAEQGLGGRASEQGAFGAALGGYREALQLWGPWRKELAWASPRQDRRAGSGACLGSAGPCRRPRRGRRPLRSDRRWRLSAGVLFDLRFRRWLWVLRRFGPAACDFLLVWATERSPSNGASAGGQALPCGGWPGGGRNQALRGAQGWGVGRDRALVAGTFPRRVEAVRPGGLVDRPVLRWAVDRGAGPRHRHGGRRAPEADEVHARVLSPVGHVASPRDGVPPEQA